MKVIKKGKDIKFMRVCEVDIYEVKCEKCGAILEAQYGEIGREECGGWHSMYCPSCGASFSTCNVNKVRRECMPVDKVRNYDCLHSPTHQITTEEWERIKAGESVDDFPYRP